MPRPISTEEANEMRLKGYETQKARAKRRREIAMQCYAKGSTVQEIADAMNTSQRQVYRYLDGLLVDRRYKKRDSEA